MFLKPRHLGWTTGMMETHRQVRVSRLRIAGHHAVRIGETFGRAPPLRALTLGVCEATSGVVKGSSIGVQ